MELQHFYKLRELRANLYCRKLVTLILVNDELTKRSPDFENVSIRTATEELQAATEEIRNFVNQHIFPGSSSWN